MHIGGVRPATALGRRNIHRMLFFCMEIIARARRVAGIKPPGEEFDWETVPLESLERR